MGITIQTNGKEYYGHNTQKNGSLREIETKATRK